jgi:hypothetical protein
LPTARSEEGGGREVTGPDDKTLGVFALVAGNKNVLRCNEALNGEDSTRRRKWKRLQGII